VIPLGSTPESTDDAERTPSSGGVYSIGALASLIDVPPATLRTWEERYGVIVPERTPAGHRLYSRDQMERLRFIKSEIARGKSAADAHRMLAEQSRLSSGRDRPRSGASSPRLLVMVAERDEYSAELIEFFLRTEGFGVEVVLDVDEAKQRFEESGPQLSIVDFLIDGGAGEELCRWLKERGTAPVLVVSGLDAADRALKAGADAFIPKPVGHLRLVSAVKDLLGVSAIFAPPSRAGR
jgi:DNA-binding transcriptional MerR regulator